MYLRFCIFTKIFDIKLRFQRGIRPMSYMNDKAKMSEEEILRAVEKVFKANFKSDYHFGKQDMWGRKTIPFDTTI